MINRTVIARTLVNDIVRLSNKGWKCSYCGALTTILSEVCFGCGEEDVEQGGCKK